MRMVETKDSRIDIPKNNSRYINFFILALGVKVPFATPILGIILGVLVFLFGVVLLSSGIYTYRRSSDAAIRGIAIAIVAGGIIVLLIGLLILYGLAAYTITTSTVENYPGR